MVRGKENVNCLGLGEFDSVAQTDAPAWCLATVNITSRVGEAKAGQARDPTR